MTRTRGILTANPVAGGIRGLARRLMDMKISPERVELEMNRKGQFKGLMMNGKDVANTHTDTHTQ